MGATWAHAIHRLLEPERRQWKNFGRYYIRRAYGARLALNGHRLITANYSWHKITQLPDGDITERMRQAFLHAGGMPRLRDAGTQVTRAPPRQHTRTRACTVTRTRDNKKLQRAHRFTLPTHTHATNAKSKED